MVMSENDAGQKKSEHSVKLPYLYKEGSKILQAYAEKKGSLKSLVYATRQERLYRRLLALVCRAVDQQPAVDAALAAVGLLTAEPGLDVSTARLLTAELLYGAGQLASQARPVLTVQRYADRLRAAAPAPAPAADGDGAGDGAESTADRPQTLPRYARVNTLLASVDDVIKQLTAEGWERVGYPPEVTYDQFIAQVKALSGSQFLLDLHVPCLLVFPAGTELHQHPLYRAGKLILQDKASCLPPLVLAPSAGEEVIDACSAPGMKTSQLAAMMKNKGKLVAVERDQGRFQTLTTMLRRAGVTNARLICGDFLKLRPADYPRVTAILMDPSCSGTGMVSRAPEEAPTEDRLRRLSNLQGMLLRHALSFPAVRRVVYSTCSVTEQENEQVVADTLAAHPGWRLAAAAPATWRGRGRTTLAGGERCIRADPADDLCHGFFVAAFEKADGETAPAGGSRRKEKRKRGGAAEAGAVTQEASGGKKRRSSSVAVEGEKSDGEPDGKKTESGEVEEKMEKASGGKKAAGPAVSSSDVPTEAGDKKKKKKRKRGRSVDKKEQANIAQAKQDGSEQDNKVSNDSEATVPPKKKRKRSKAGRHISDTEHPGSNTANGNAGKAATPGKTAENGGSKVAKKSKRQSRLAKANGKTVKRLSKKRRMAIKSKTAASLTI